MTTTSPVNIQAPTLPSTRMRVVAASLAGSALAIAVLVATRPWGPRIDSSSDEVFVYDKILPHRDGAWVGLLVDGLAFGVLGVCLALAVCHLIRGRGGVPATVGAMLTVTGGILSAMGGLAFATLGWYATAVSEDSSAELVHYVNDHPGHAMAGELAGFLVFTLGTVVLAIAVLRAKVVPVAAVVLFALITVALFTVPSGRATDVVQIAQSLVLGAMAIPLWKRP